VKKNGKWNGADTGNEIIGDIKMKLTNKQLKQIIKEELDKVLNEQIDRETLIKRIDDMASSLGVSSQYSAEKIGDNVINAALEYVSQNSIDNAFDTDFFDGDRADSIEDIMNEENFMDLDLAYDSGMPDFGLSSDQHVDFIFAIYSAYYDAFK